MNILLTGATGYIGRRLQERLLRDDSVHLRLFVRNSRKVHHTAGNRFDLFEGEESFRKALEEIEKKQVISRWCDSSAQRTCDIREKDGLESAVFREKISYDFGSTAPEKIFTVVESIGGDNGWFRYDWLWRLRGFMDILFGGPGLSRGRRDPDPQTHFCRYGQRNRQQSQDHFLNFYNSELYRNILLLL